MMTALPALAQPEDIIGSSTFTAQQITDAATALERASTAVRAYCRQKFTVTTQTHRIVAVSSWLRMILSPVISVDSVAILINGVPTPITGWIWDGFDRIWTGDVANIINLSEEVLGAIQYTTIIADVKYTSGYATIPDEVVAVTADLASRALAIPGGGVVTQQSAGPYSYSIASWARGGPLALSDVDKSILNSFRKMGSSIELRM